MSKSKNSSKSILQVQKLDSRATIPSRELDANGYDLYPLEPYTLARSETKWIDTGLAIAPPEGCYLRIAMRSGYGGKGLIAGAGVVDWNYRGPLKVLVHCFSKTPIELVPTKAFAQFVLEVCKTPPIVEVTELEETIRGSRGFGSTDKPAEPQHKKSKFPAQLTVEEHQSLRQLKTDQMLDYSK